MFLIGPLPCHQKGPIKWDPSFLRPSGSFVGTGSFFFENLYGVRSPHVDVLDRAEFSRKNPHWTKMTKNGCRTL